MKQVHLSPHTTTTIFHLSPPPPTPPPHRSPSSLRLSDFRLIYSVNRHIFHFEHHLQVPMTEKLLKRSSLQ
ncbi:hypothetical protein HanHA300_Chr14g0507571 [Helianthus annuus]|nr:hypothetical protein HanHA300_Chr14g0507571 [Helianthus annuus]KAJ0484081.1 hypothetical protein HanHA89_Chr14g0540191 [Helianthus annuus]